MTTTNYPRCATCAHWRKDDRFSEFGLCRLFDVAGMSGLVFNMAYGPEFNSEVESVTTVAAFGCINHSEIKEG